MVKDPSNSKVNDILPMVQKSLVCQGPSLSRLHDRARQDFSGRVIGPSQKPLCDNKTITRNRHPCPWHDSNSQFQQARGPQNHALDRAATGIGNVNDLVVYICITENSHLSG